LAKKWNPTKDKDGFYKLPAGASAHSVLHYKPRAPANLLELKSDPICDSSGCNQYKFPKDTSDDHPVDYPVPNFGRDHDIISTFNSLDVAEAMKQHHWDFDPDAVEKPEAPTEYDLEPKLDDDIIDTQHHAILAKTTFKVEDAAAATPAAAETAAPANATAAAEQAAVQKTEKKAGDATLLQSDPICNSAGCTQYKFPEPAGKKAAEYPMDYFVPNFGRDRDVINTFNSLRKAEQMRRHHWVVTDEDLKKKDDPPVEYNGDPALDDDIIGTVYNMRQAESRLGKWDWIQLADEEDGDYNALQI